MYEEYMQNLLGLQISPYKNTLEKGNGCYTQMSEFDQIMPPGFFTRNSINNVNLEKEYPEIYNIVYPMVRKACWQNTRPITRELIDEMTQDIYSNVETGNGISLNINMDGDFSEGDRSEKKVEENRNIENRQHHNLMNDLIKILIIRELMKTPNNRPNFPPVPNQPGGGFGSGMPIPRF